MNDDRAYIQVPPRRAQWSITVVILIANVIVFGIQGLVPRVFPNFDFDRYFALSLDGLRHGFFWQFLTYQFMHGGFLHIFLNSWAIYVFGREIERIMGKLRMAELYFLSGIVGGALQIALAWFFPRFFAILISPGHYDEQLIGASAGAYALIAAAAAIFPRQPLYMLLFMVVPVKMRTLSLLWVCIALSVAGIAAGFFHYEFMGHVGHAAHLGGIIMGYLLARQWLQSFRVPPVVAEPPPKSPLKITAAQD